GESAQAPAVPTGSTATPTKGVRRRSPNEWAENRPPAQSNQRAERERSLHQKPDGHRRRTPGIGKAKQLRRTSPSSCARGAGPLRGPTHPLRPAAAAVLVSRGPLSLSAAAAAALRR